jgi:hypothetical protein
MLEPELIKRDALEGRRVALSVSESADLMRLGLTEYHCRLVVAEVSRAIMLAGGIVVYGGNLSSSGYTRILIDEAQRFGGGTPSLEIVLDESTRASTPISDVNEVDRQLGQSYGHMFVMEHDNAVLWSERDPHHGWAGDAVASLTAMRRHVSSASSARLLVGGKLKGYLGDGPGVIEEARLSTAVGNLVLIAGGYGGAAAALLGVAAPSLRSGVLGLPNFPDDAESVSEHLDSFGAVLAEAGAPAIDQTTGPGRTLALSHRPADIATSTVQLLAGHFADHP